MGRRPKYVVDTTTVARPLPDRITMEIWQIKDLITSIRKIEKLEGGASDIISQNEAFSIYGRATVIQWREKGLVHPVRKGTTANSKLYYSHAELETIAASEALHPIFYNAI